jgi:hypothetical protein
MKEPITDLADMLRQLRPRRQPGEYVFATLPDGAHLPPAAVGWFRETEGVSVVLPAADADRLGLTAAFRAAWITLEVPSALAGVGLTAAVAGALAAAGIACNVIAAVRHDHLFVPLDRGGEAVAVLLRLQANAGR